MRSFWIRLRHLCVLPIFVFALITGLRGIDYGGHPDEHVIFAGVKQMLNSGVFLPRWYGYPSFSFYVALLPLLKYTATLRLAPELCFGSRPDSSDSLQEASLFEGYVNKHPDLLAVVDADTSGRTKSDIGKAHYCGSGRFEGRTADIYDTPQLRQLKEVYQEHLPNNTSRKSPRLFHRLSTHVGSNDYILNVRTISLTISLFSIFWVYVAVWNWRRSWAESLLAASLLGLSWEMAYHARWFVPDSMMMQFAALMLMFLSYAHRSSNPGVWLKCAAVAVGLACGTKYTGGILLVPLMISVFYYLKTWPLLAKYRKTILLFGSSILLGGALGYIAGMGHRDQQLVVLAGCVVGGLLSKWLSEKKLKSWFRPVETTVACTNQLEFSPSVQIRLYVGIVFLVGLAFLITTPALMLEPVKVWEFVLYQKHAYSSPGINGYSVLEQLDHLQRVIIYLSAVLFSKNTVIAIFFAVMSLIGLYCLRTEKALVMILALVIVIYILYISRYQLMYVRNLQILIPFLAILSAIGCGYGQQRFVRFFSRQAIVPAQVYRYTWPVLLVVLVFVNGNWIYNAAASIDQYNQNSGDFRSRQLESLKSYIENHPDKSFVLSKKLNERWSAAGYPDYPQLGREQNLDAGAYGVFSSSEAVSKHNWTIGANRFQDYFVVSPGPYEVNFDYYPTVNPVKDRIVIAQLSNVLNGVGSIFPTTMSLDRTSVTQIAHHVPGFEVDALEPLIDLEFQQEAGFFKAISNNIGLDSANAYWGVIWAFTRFSLISEQ
jgi:4-amino-4-deoxy-L-arabinose transferase-like glycosyltransferase